MNLNVDRLGYPDSRSIDGQLAGLRRIPYMLLFKRDQLKYQHIVCGCAGVQ
jgi:hypothetical protein